MKIMVLWDVAPCNIVEITTPRRKILPLSSGQKNQDCEQGNGNQGH
jgi:hypothetical protein